MSSRRGRPGCEGAELKIENRKKKIESKNHDGTVSTVPFCFLAEEERRDLTQRALRSARRGR